MADTLTTAAPLGTPAPAPTPRKRNLAGILGDNYGYLDQPGQGTDFSGLDKAYDDSLSAAEASRSRDEAASTANVLDNLQSRGIARSGIAIKDVINQVLGPSLERSNALAAQFNLPKAQARVNASEANLNREGNLDQSLVGGRLSSILQGENLQGQTSLANLNNNAEYQRLVQQLASNERVAQANRDQEAAIAAQNRKSSRRGGIVGGLSSIVGSYLGRK